MKRLRAIRKTALLSVLAFLLLGVVVCYRHTLVWRNSPMPPGVVASGVVFYDRLRTQDGYNVFNDGLNLPSCELFDMDGNEVYKFPKSQCYFFKDGSVLLTALGEHSQLYDPSGRLLWDIPGPTTQDFDVSEDESEIFLIGQESRPVGDKTLRIDIVKGFSRNGQKIFEWDTADHIQDIEKYFDRKIQPTHYYVTDELTHLNSVQPLPANDLEKSNPAFKRGNILVNCFINQVTFIIERESGKIVWGYQFEGEAFTRSFDKTYERGAHTVKMLANGRLIYFHNNAKYSYSSMEFSSIVELDPISKNVAWIYHGNPAGDFRSVIWGAVYVLPNGNRLVTNSTSGSAFEITPQGRLVWEWINPVKDRFAMAEPFRSMKRVPKATADKIIRVWRELK